MTPCEAPLPLSDLLAYLHDELADAELERVEEHYFGCAACAARLAAVERLGAQLRALMTAGRVAASVTHGLVERAAGAGLKLRTYRLAPGEQVACTASPQDDLLVIRLALTAAPDEQVDLAAEVTTLPGGERQTILTEEVALDRERGELVLVYPGEQVRAYPRTRWSLEAHLRGPAGERRVGPYTLDHTPWEQLPPSRR